MVFIHHESTGIHAWCGAVTYTCAFWKVPPRMFFPTMSHSVRASYDPLETPPGGGSCDSFAPALCPLCLRDVVGGMVVLVV